MTESKYRAVMIKELPQQERPREKMLTNGPQALSDTELLAILLRTGTQQQSVMRLAEQLIVQFNGLAGLSVLSPQEMSKIKGIGLTKAITVAAAIELGRRLSSLSVSSRPIIRSPKDAADIVMARLRYEQKEHFMVLLLSTKNHVIAVRTISLGTLNASLVHPRELFREAIIYSAAAVILVHNHPSGDPTPSNEDIMLTRNLVAAGKIMEISVLDHVIIGDGKYVSLKEKGIL